MTQDAARRDIIGRLKGLAGPRACEEAVALIAGDGERLAEQERSIVALTQERDAFQARAIAAEAEAKSERDRRHGAVADIWRLADPDAPPSSSDEREALEALTARIAKLLNGGRSTAVDVRNFPPGPWTLSWSETFCRSGVGHVYMVDASGKKIAPIWGPGDVKEELARRILDACNTAFFGMIAAEEEAK